MKINSSNATLLFIPLSFESMHGKAQLQLNLFCNELECVMTNVRQSHPFLFKEITFATRYFCVEFGQYQPH